MLLNRNLGLLNYYILALEIYDDCKKNTFLSNHLMMC